MTCLLGRGADAIPIRRSLLRRRTQTHVIHTGEPEKLRYVPQQTQRSQNDAPTNAWTGPDRLMFHGQRPCSRLLMKQRGEYRVSGPAPKHQRRTETEYDALIVAEKFP